MNYTGNIFDISEVLNSLRDNNKKCRLSIVINKYNYTEIEYTLEYLNQFSDVLSYIQLRKIYKYYNNQDTEEDKFDTVVNWIKSKCTKCDNFYESEVYKYKELNISLWRDVFVKDSIQSINYFTNGIISTNNLLIPAYEKGETD